MSTANIGPSHERVLDAKWDGRDTFTVPEAAEILRVSRGTAYEAVKKGELPVIWIGRRCIVPRRRLEKMLDECAA
jgi:excisionase family DNA binding protein